MFEVYLHGLQFIFKPSVERSPYGRALGLVWGKVFGDRPFNAPNIASVGRRK